MILGICMGPDEAAISHAAKTGYRYIETGLRRFLDDPALLDGFLRALDKNKIRCEVGQHPFPGAYDPSGKQSAEALEKTRDEFYGVIKKTSALNIEKLVFGAGGARVLPSPDKYDNAMEQMADILKYAVSPVLSEFGIILTLEGLNKKETDILLTTADSVRLAKMANLPNIKVMADLYHVNLEEENYADFPNYAGYILHSHIGKPRPRVMPKPDDGFPYADFFAALRSARFNGRMSLEAGADGDYFECMELAYKTLEPLL